MQAELQLAKERLRRKSAVLARQEEEIAARGKAIDTAAVDAQALQHAMDRAQQDAEAYKARRSCLRYLLCKTGKIISGCHASEPLPTFSGWLYAESADSVSTSIGQSLWSGSAQTVDTC